MSVISMDKSTRITYPGGAINGQTTVVATGQWQDQPTVILAETPFHPEDHNWPDQPADKGTITINGETYTVVNCVTGAHSAESAVLIDKDIPVKRGEAGWHFQVVHVLDREPGDVVGAVADCQVDEAYRAGINRAHSALHIVGHAFNLVLAEHWRKPCKRELAGVADSYGSIIQSCRLSPDHSDDVYRIGKSTRKAGFPHEYLRENLAEVEAAVNAKVAEWIATGAQVSVTPGADILTGRRQWQCDLTEGALLIPCGGSHVASLSEIGIGKMSYRFDEATGLLHGTLTTTAA